MAKCLDRMAGFLQSQNVPFSPFFPTVQSEAELATLARSVTRGTPFGRESRTTRFAKRLGLESTLQPRGRPPKSQTM
jgi:hypothetical protein